MDKVTHEELLKTHGKEWERISQQYKSMSINNDDIYYYRHRCIEGLISGNINDF